MGMTISELPKLGDKGPRHFAKRVPRANFKRTVYEVASIREFLEAG